MMMRMVKIGKVKIGRRELLKYGGYAVGAVVSGWLGSYTKDILFDRPAVENLKRRDREIEAYELPYGKCLKTVDVEPHRLFDADEGFSPYNSYVSVKAEELTNGNGDGEKDYKFFVFEESPYRDVFEKILDTYTSAPCVSLVRKAGNGNGPEDDGPRYKITVHSEIVDGERVIFTPESRLKVLYSKDCDV